MRLKLFVGRVALSEHQASQRACMVVGDSEEYNQSNGAMNDGGLIDQGLCSF